MQITRMHDFSHPIEKCWEMFHDPASHVAKFTAMGHRDLEVISEERSDDQLRIEIERIVDVDVPGFAKKVIKPSNMLRSVDEWNDFGDGTYGGTFDLDTKGVPIQTKGRTSLEPNDDGTAHYTVTIDLKVKVPLIGGRLENFSKGLIDDQLTQEFALGDAWLDEH